jgi:hypothetical protein
MTDTCYFITTEFYTKQQENNQYYKHLHGKHLMKIVKEKKIYKKKCINTNSTRYKPQVNWYERELQQPMCECKTGFSGPGSTCSPIGKDLL